jgi:hypothetical protein
VISRFIYSFEFLKLYYVMKVCGLVEDAKEKGADCLMGGAPHPAGELFYQPTILTGVQPNMALFQVAERYALYVPGN